MAALRIFARYNLSRIIRAPATTDTFAATQSAVLQVHKRWGSYKSSPIYKDPSHYTDYEISKDPNEWKYVERLLKPKVVPKPKLAEKDLPSGWTPVVANPQNHPYFVRRTKNYMQPVYLLKEFRGMRTVTHIKKIDGDIWMFEQELKQHIETKMNIKVASRVNELIGEIKFKGDYVAIVKQWLDSKGF